jgi:hypothetical protein
MIPKMHVNCHSVLLPQPHAWPLAAPIKSPLRSSLVVWAAFQATADAVVEGWLYIN